MRSCEKCSGTTRRDASESPRRFSRSRSIQFEAGDVMGEILGIGCSHGPGITGPLTRLTDIYLRRNLQSELTQVHMKDPKNWPINMQDDLDLDEDLSFATENQPIL